MNSYFSAGVISGQSILDSTCDEMLVTAAKSGELLAFSELWDRHSKKVFNTMYRITKNRQDAEDALQDAFLRVFVHLKQFDGRSTFSTWFTRIAINSALIILRKKRSHPETSMDWGADGEGWSQWEMADQRANAEEHYAREEEILHLKQAIRCLRPSLRNIIELQQLHDTSIGQIAEIAGISVAATKSRMLRARTMLRRSLR